MAKTEFDYYYGAESEQFSFVRVPRVLFTDKEHFGGLSNEAKMLYGFLLERMSLSRRNNWIDELNRVYIVFPIEEIEELLGVSHDKANNLLKELDDVKGIGLVSKKRRGLGLPSILYVKNFIINSCEPLKGEALDTTPEPEKKAMKLFRLQEVWKMDFKKSEKQTSRSLKIRLQEVRKMDFKKSENQTLIILKQIILKRVILILNLSILHARIRKIFRLEMFKTEMPQMLKVLKTLMD